MTHEEYVERLKDLASKACILRAGLDELSDDCHEEWCNSESFSIDESDWYERYNWLYDLAASVSEVEQELSEEDEDGR